MAIEKLKETPSQTAGPYVHIGTLPGLAGIVALDDGPLNRIAGAGERIRIEGLVLDGSGAPLKDAVIELWQADHEGRVGAHGLWGRTASDFSDGSWDFETVRPPAGDGGAPSLTFLVFARGINIHLHTRMYFPEDRELHTGDPVLGRIEPRHRVDTLVAEKTGEATYRFVIRLQGDDETVFFDI